MLDQLQVTAILLRERLVAILGSLPDLFSELGAFLAAASPTGSPWWHLGQMAIGVVFAAFGYAAAHYVRTHGQRRLNAAFNGRALRRADKILYLLVRTLLGVFAALLLGVVGLALAILFHGSVAQRVDFMLPVIVTTLVYLIWAVFSGLTAQGATEYRLVRLDDGQARDIVRSLTWAAVIGFAFAQTAAWLLRLGAPEDFAAHVLLRVVGSLATTGILVSVAIRHRRDIGAAISGGGLATGIVGAFSRIWHIPAVAYFVGAWLVGAARYILGAPSAQGLVASPIYALLAGFVVYAILIVLVDYIALRRRRNQEASASSGAEELRVYRPPLLVLAEHAATVLAWTAALGLLAWFWGLDLSRDGFVANLADVALIVFAGWLAYSAVSVVINQKIEQEGGVEVAEPGEEGGGHGGISRIAMLLSLFRKFLLVTIVTIVGMIALSQLGVDIGPLFAGAGVVGLAVGFGAQTLVRDIFSGAFFLMDDAFRIGEYIDVGSVKGTVEKISVRSMQLRHHMGALHTIPFGEITHLTNYSRDWVMMKLKLRVTYDTDIERVRKLIKKLGQQLLEHPEVGDKFMQPLKSQGVYSMEDDTAIIIRVKFMTRPGDQFQTRKVVYQAIRDLFAEEGIQFATRREVVVRVEGGEDEEQTRQAAGAAAAEAIRAGSDQHRE
jgi:small-conductance mechanosensitive channel